MLMVITEHLIECALQDSFRSSFRRVIVELEAESVNRALSKQPIEAGISIFMSCSQILYSTSEVS
jgi:hypothetical protein